MRVVSFDEGNGFPVLFSCTFRCDHPGCEKKTMRTVRLPVLFSWKNLPFDFLEWVLHSERGKQRGGGETAFFVFPEKGYDRNTCWPHHVRVLCEHHAFARSSKVIRKKKQRRRTQRQTGHRNLHPKRPGH